MIAPPPRCSAFSVVASTSAPPASGAAIDRRPVHFLFLIVAPPLEVSNQYLPVLGRIAQFAKDADIPDRLASLTSPADFFALLESRGV